MPFEGVFYGSFRAMPFKGVSYGSFRAMPFKGVSYDSFRAMPFKGVSCGSIQAMPFKGVSCGSFRAMPSEGVSYRSFRATPFESVSYGSFQAMPFKGTSYGFIQAMPSEGISYDSVQATSFEYGPFGAMPFGSISFLSSSLEGTMCIFLQPLSLRDIFYCSHQVVSLKNIQPVCFMHSSYECNCLLSAHWYLGDLVAQLLEVVLSYLSPVIRFMLEFTQKITIWYNDFMLHWFTSLRKTRNSIHLVQLFLCRNFYTRPNFVAATMKVVRDNLKCCFSIRVFLPKCLCKNKGQPRSLRLYLFRLYRRTSLMIGIL